MRVNHAEASALKYVTFFTIDLSAMKARPIIKITKAPRQACESLYPEKRSGLID